MRKLLLCTALMASATGCTSFREGTSGTPALSEVGDPRKLQETRVVAMPLPTVADQQRAPNALWSIDKRSFFRDQRAQAIGDILTVVIDIQDEARLSNSTGRSRDASENLGVGALWGAEDVLRNAMPNGFDPENAVDYNSSSSADGEGSINRNESISLRVAAVVTDRLPNGNFVVAGRQEVRVNSELRELRVAGVIRPQDITSLNTIDYSKIAEARISYGGRGTLTKTQKPRYGQRFYEIIAPF